MAIKAPSLADLKETAAIFNGFGDVDRSWFSLCSATAPGLDLARAGHRDLLLRWLNSWGCRIRYPRDGEPALFDTGVGEWWSHWVDQLPCASLADLDDAEISMLSRAYADLRAVPVSEGRSARSIGPTAAAKALYAIRPRSVMPWDAAIALRLHGSRESEAFARHLALGRAWAGAILREVEVEEGAVSELVGRPGIPLSKILDEYLYTKLSMNQSQTL